LNISSLSTETQHQKPSIEKANAAPDGLELNAQLVAIRCTENTISETAANQQATATLHGLRHATHFDEAT